MGYPAPAARSTSGSASAGGRRRSAPARRRKPEGRARQSAVRRFLKALGATEGAGRTGNLAAGPKSRRTGASGRRGPRGRRGRPAIRLSPPAIHAERLSFLSCDGVGEYPLTRAGVFRIGRSVYSDLVLPITSVSRVHASVEWRGDAYHCHDLLSQNGTYVNGKKVNCWRLQVGDEIRIGGVLIRFRERPSSGPLSSGALGSACIVRDAREPGRDRRVTLRGDLDKVKLQEIIPFLELHRRTGILEVRGEGAGRIYFSQGDVIQARTRGALGTEAFFRLLGQHKGTFLFEEGRARTDRAIEAPATALILEALRRMDELAEPRPDQNRVPS